VTSLEQAAGERGQQPEQVIRSLVFRLAEGEYLMVLVAGPAQVNWKTLRSYLGLSRLTTATEEEVLAVTGYTRGAVAPFGLPEPMRILVDESVFRQPEVSLGSGVRGTAVILTRADLKRALGEVEVGRFTD
jgi:Cys-tRNA(Pro) deacylase